MPLTTWVKGTIRLRSGGSSGTLPAEALLRIGNSETYASSSRVGCTVQADADDEILLYPGLAHVISMRKSLISPVYSAVSNGRLLSGDQNGMIRVSSRAGLAVAPSPRAGLK